MSAARFIVLNLEEAFVVRTALSAQQQSIARLEPSSQVLCTDLRDIGKSLIGRLDAKFRADCVRLGIVEQEPEA